MAAPPLDAMKKRKRITFDDLWLLKCQSHFNITNKTKEPTWYDFIITAVTKKDFVMEVWNGKSSSDKRNFKNHICKAGSKVRVWMVSRFGDAGITDNLINPNGYDCRNVDVDNDLKDITIEPRCHSKREIYSKS